MAQHIIDIDVDTIYLYTYIPIEATSKHHASLVPTLVRHTTVDVLLSWMALVKQILKACNKLLLCDLQASGMEFRIGQLLARSCDSLHGSCTNYQGLFEPRKPLALLSTIAHVHV